LLALGCQADKRCPAAWEPLYDAETETAALVSDWLRQAELAPDPQALVHAMQTYHLQKLPADLRDAVHEVGSAGLYQDPPLLLQVLTHVERWTLRRFPLVAEMGGYHLRDITGMGFWDLGEPSQGQYHWELADLVLQSAQDHGLEPIVTLQPFALWDQQAAGHQVEPDNEFMYQGGDYFPLQQNTGPGPAGDPQALASFAQALAARGDLSVFELGNEPGSLGGGYEGDPQALGQLQGQLRQALGTEVTLCNGGATELSAGSDFAVFWGEALAAEGGADIDVFNLHYNLEEEAVQQDCAALNEQLAQAQALLDARSLDLPIWLSEFGTGLGSEDDIAGWHLKRLCCASARGVEKVFVDLLANTADEELKDAIQGRAMAETASWDDDQITLRLLFWTAKLINLKLAGFSAVEERLPEAQYRFSLPAGEVWVLWGQHTLPKELQGELLQVTDLYGQVQELGSDELQLDRRPVFVEVAGD